MSTPQRATPRLSVADSVRSLRRILAGKPQVPSALAGNELLGIILDRRSTRRFADKAIDDDVFAVVLEAARVAPSTVNLQSWTLMTFSAESWRTTFGTPIPFKAQRAVMVCADTHRYRAAVPAFPRSPLVEYTIAVTNASLAAMNMNIAAEALGVASVMLSETGRTGLLDTGHLARKLALPQGVFPLMTIVFGYPTTAPPPMPPKLPLDEVAPSDGRYHEPDSEVLRDWVAQMTAGYKAMHPFSSLEDQLAIYESKIGPAEEDLRRMIFGEDDSG